jgi:flagellar biosynthesis/type III secretory pathway protein FliH
MNKLVFDLIREYRPEVLEAAISQGIQQGREQGIQQGREQGIQQGMQRGREEGREEGIREGSAALTIRLLTRKLGMIDEETLARVRNLSLEELETLGEELLDFQSATALKEWLDRMRTSH